jgi:hypothetical protein
MNSQKIRSLLAIAVFAVALVVSMATPAAANYAPQSTGEPVMIYMKCERDGIYYPLGSVINQVTWIDPITGKPIATSYERCELKTVRSPGGAVKKAMWVQYFS